MMPVNLQDGAPPRHLNYIDGLRALAVLSVIANHYFEAFLPAGYLGVDIFFVISGYVITLNLQNAPCGSMKQFLLNFYARRMKRLLPALLLCVLVTTGLFVLLTTLPAVSVYLAASYAVFGLSNIYLYVTSFDYFSLDAQLNPFTHTWSLGVEEQFYLLYPALFYALGLTLVTSRSAKTGTGILGALTIASLGFYVLVSRFDPNGAFYLLPARFWELSLGALTCLVHERGWRPTIPALPDIALIALAFVLAIPSEIQPAATAACAFVTALLLISLGGRSIAGRALTLNLTVYIGKISYSLYLWHWCLLVLGKWTLGETLQVKLTLLILLPAFACCSYHFVESPLRYAQWFRYPGRTIAAGLAAASLTVIIVNLGFAKFSSSNNQILASIAGVVPPDVLAVSSKPDLACPKYSAQSPDAFLECLCGERTAEKPHFLYVIGDSHALLLKSTIESAVSDTAYTVRLLQTGKGQELPGAYLRAGAHPVPVTDFITRRARPGDIVLVAFHRGLLNAHRDTHVPLSQRVEQSPQGLAYIENMRRWAKELAAAGVGLILVQDSPLMRVISPVTACALQISLTGSSVCRVSLEQDLHTRERQDMALAAIAKDIPSAVLWDAGRIFFAERGFADVLDADGRYMMADWNHLSAGGAERLVPEFRSFFQSLLRQSTILSIEDRPVFASPQRVQ
jgi:peptidoglycan/LPS O-acetylase OafA/YrhL